MYRLRGGRGGHGHFSAGRKRPGHAAAAFRYTGPPVATEAAQCGIPLRSYLSCTPHEVLRLIVGHLCCLDAVLSLGAAYPDLITAKVARGWALDVALAAPWPSSGTFHRNARIHSVDSAEGARCRDASGDDSLDDRPVSNPISAAWVSGEVASLDDLRLWHAPHRRVCRVCLARPLGRPYSTLTARGVCPCQAPSSAPPTCCNHCAVRLLRAPSRAREFSAAVRAAPTSVARLMSMPCDAVAARDLFMPYLQCVQRGRECALLRQIVENGLHEEAEKLLSQVRDAKRGAPLIDPWKWARTGLEADLGPVRRFLQAESAGLLVSADGSPSVSPHGELFGAVRCFILRGAPSFERCTASLDEAVVIIDAAALAPAFIENNGGVDTACLGDFWTLQEALSLASETMRPMDALTEFVGRRLAALYSEYRERGVCGVDFGRGLDAVRAVGRSIAAAEAHRAAPCPAGNDRCLQAVLDRSPVKSRVAQRDPRADDRAAGGGACGKLAFPRLDSSLCLRVAAQQRDAPSFDMFALAELIQLRGRPTDVEKAAARHSAAQAFGDIRITRTLAAAAHSSARMVASNLSGLNVFLAYGTGFDEEARDRLAAASDAVVCNPAEWGSFFAGCPIGHGHTIGPWFRSRDKHVASVRQAVASLAKLGPRERFWAVFRSLEREGLGRDRIHDAMENSAVVQSFIAGFNGSHFGGCDGAELTCRCRGGTVETLCRKTADPCWQVAGIESDALPGASDDDSLAVADESSDEGSSEDGGGVDVTPDEVADLVSDAKKDLADILMPLAGYTAPVGGALLDRATLHVPLLSRPISDAAKSHCLTVDEAAVGALCTACVDAEVGKHEVLAGGEEFASDDHDEYDVDAELGDTGADTVEAIRRRLEDEGMRRTMAAVFSNPGRTCVEAFRGCEAAFCEHVAAAVLRLARRREERARAQELYEGVLHEQDYEDVDAWDDEYGIDAHGVDEDYFGFFDAY
jgi:hypothetical protein